jgi:hypothetical protein
VPPVASSAEQESSAQADEAPAVESGAAQAAPGQFEVDEEAAERALERTLVVTGALLLPFGKAEIQPRFAYIRSEEDAPTAHCQLFFNIVLPHQRILLFLVVAAREKDNTIDHPCGDREIALRCMDTALSAAPVPSRRCA